MTAQSTDKPRKRTKTPRTRSNRKVPSGTIANNIVTLAVTTPAKPIEIAESLNTSVQHVCQTLERYGIDHKAVDSYKKQRSDIFAGLQEKILSSVELDDIKSASVLQRITAAGILYDKERLETGKSTGNMAVLIGRIEDAQRQIAADE